MKDSKKYRAMRLIIKVAKQYKLKAFINPNLKEFALVGDKWNEELSALGAQLSSLLNIEGGYYDCDSLNYSGWLMFK